MVWNRATIADSQWSQRCLGDVRNTLHNQECLHGVSGCSHRWSKYFHQTRAQIKASLLRPACFQNKKGLIGVIFLMYLLVGSPWFFSGFFSRLFFFFPQSLTVKEKNDPQLFSSLSYMSAGWYRIRGMFALRFPPHQRQSLTDLNRTPKTVGVLNYHASLIFGLEQKWRKVSGKAGVSSLYIQAVSQFVWGCHVWLGLAHISGWLLRLCTS